MPNVRCYSKKVKNFTFLYFLILLIISTKMRETIPEPKKENIMIEQELIDQVRQNLIKALREALEIYTHHGQQEWVNKEICLQFIEDLKAKRHGEIGGPFWSDLLDGVLYDLGIKRTREQMEKYDAIWNAIEAGK
ncbi:MAG: hypothetical protein V1661_03430 [bacterium]